jgi:hypothetical protein
MAETTDGGNPTRENAGPEDSEHRFETFGRRVDERLGTALPRIEEEVKKAIAYLNDEVAPRVRQNSSQALQIAAERLRQLADYLDKRSKSDLS